MSNTKISILFFDDREVRAIWDEDHAKWWFSVLDVVALLTDRINDREMFMSGIDYSYYYEE